MDTYSNGSANFVLIDTPNFIASISWADKRGHRIRMSDSRTFIQFHKDNHISFEFVRGISLELPGSKITIINKGLMKGLYLYTVNDRTNEVSKVYYYFDSNDTRYKPLIKYRSDCLVYDLIISYNNKDLPKARKLFRKLNKAFEVFFIDIENIENDPIWNIRYREAMYYSHYFTPYFTENYLNSAGALAECFEAVSLNSEETTPWFFYYFIPLVENDTSFQKNYISHVASLSVDDIGRLMANSGKTDEMGVYNTVELEKNLNTVYSLNLKQGNSFVFAFLHSILENNKDRMNLEMPILNYDFLTCLLKDSTYVQFHSSPSRKINYVTLFIPIAYDKNAHLMILISSDGKCTRYNFTTETELNAERIKNIKKIFRKITRHLENKW